MGRTFTLHPATPSGVWPGSSSGKGKTPMADAYESMRLSMAEYQSLLEVELLNAELGGSAQNYEIACASHLMGLTNVGIAFSVKDHRVYALVAANARPDRHNLRFWLLDMAKELTEILRTFVVPDQPSEFTYWGANKQVIAYQFKMADAPDSVEPASTSSD